MTDIKTMPHAVADPLDALAAEMEEEIAREAGPEALHSDGSSRRLLFSSPAEDRIAGQWPPVPERPGERLAADPVAHPPHYTAHPSGVECIAVAQHFNFCLGNAIKYIWRADHKGRAIEDLRKAREYLDFEIARREGTP